jgi:hypothetical protein
MCSIAGEHWPVVHSDGADRHTPIQVAYWLRGMLDERVQHEHCSMFSIVV